MDQIPQDCSVGLEKPFELSPPTSCTLSPPSERAAVFDVSQVGRELLGIATENENETKVIVHFQRLSQDVKRQTSKQN